MVHLQDIIHENPVSLSGSRTTFPSLSHFASTHALGEAGKRNDIAHTLPQKPAQQSKATGSCFPYDPPLGSVHGQKCLRKSLSHAMHPSGMSQQPCETNKAAENQAGHVKLP